MLLAILCGHSPRYFRVICFRSRALGCRQDLTPLQAILIAVGLFVVMPKMLSREAFEVLKSSWIFGVGLIIAFLVFGYFCVFQIPDVLFPAE
jgi:hypothetical protein